MGGKEDPGREDFPNEVVAMEAGWTFEEDLNTMALQLVWCDQDDLASQNLPEVLKQKVNGRQGIKKAH